MFSFEAQGNIIVEENRILEAALSTNPDTQKALRKLINQVLKEARTETVAGVHSKLQSDPRGAAYGIRRIVYRKILGANLNIFNMRRRRGKPTTYEPPRTLKPGQVGGNRVPRGARTDTVMHYSTVDRLWILRILNSGTYNGNRTAGTKGGRLSGNRGAISARNFFRGAAEPTMMRAAENLAMLIDSELDKMLNKKK